MLFYGSFQLFSAELQLLLRWPKVLLPVLGISQAAAGAELLSPASLELRGLSLARDLLPASLLPGLFGPSPWAGPLALFPGEDQVFGLWLCTLKSVERVLPPPASRLPGPWPSLSQRLFPHHW